MLTGRTTYSEDSVKINQSTLNSSKTAYAACNFPTVVGRQYSSLLGATCSPLYCLPTTITAIQVTSARLRGTVPLLRVIEVLNGQERCTPPKTILIVFFVVIVDAIQTPTIGYKQTQCSHHVIKIARHTLLKSAVSVLKRPCAFT